MLHEAGWFGGGMWIFWILLIVVIVVVIKMLTDSGKSTSNDHKSALEILKQRYARGEIDDDEYQRRRHELEK